ncbi:pectate lyase [Paenibacillus borealis]|uniref:Pectate lyase n=1 Tax=Paenibacillus borealis TaxID=160799 RepID=A0ABX3HNX2_PAEBO|nr:family 16 glycoside hydrolase [Paenibacillus borealis]OMD52432.1 pectate lyase [Paenibacillus borealis]
MASKRMRLRLLSGIGFAVILALIFIVPASAASLVSYDFENEGANNWTSTTGTWSVVQDGSSSVYYQSSSSEGRTSAGNSEWTNYSVQSEVKIDNFNGSNRTLICGRYGDGNNYYAASLSNSNGGTLEIRKKLSGSSTTLAAKTGVPLSTGTWYAVKLELNGSTLKMYVNGTLQLTATDSSLTSGAIGLVAFKTAAKFDNIIVSELSGTPTATATATPSATPAQTPAATATPAATPTSVPTAAVTPTPTPSAPADAFSAYNLTGFSIGNSGGGIVNESNTALYKKVYTATDLAAALKKGSGVKVIEIMNDLNLGWNEIPSAAQTSPFAAHNSPLTHPVLLQTGVSKVTLDGFDGLTIFSANGAKIKHAAFTIKRSSNLIIRNLEFDELWEWDEASKGDFDKNDWDYITLEEDTNVWIDHCTFNKSYDGLVDSKKGTSGVTISWSTFKGDDRSSNSWVTRQINALEANSSAYPMYAYLRSSAIGLSKEDIIAVASSQKKGHLVGATSFDSGNSNLSITLHHNYYLDIQDRLPRLRGGNAHVYNILADNSAAWAAKSRITTAMETAIAGKGYHFGVTSNGSISTEGGAVLVEKSNFVDILYPLRNNQTDPADSSYTGKIKALDTMYSLNGVSFRGNSDTSGSPLAPVPAAIIPFSWSGISALPYSYPVDDPSTLAARLTASNGSGAGKLNWTKSNWLQTMY